MISKPQHATSLIRSRARRASRDDDDDVLIDPQFSLLIHLSNYHSRSAVISTGVVDVHGRDEAVMTTWISKTTHEPERHDFSELIFTEAEIEDIERGF